MSSRALRRFQRQEETVVPGQDDDFSEEEPIAAPKKKSAFEMLNALDNGDDSNSEDSVAAEEENHQNSQVGPKTGLQRSEEEDQQLQTAQAGKKSKPKKKKKKKPKAKGDASTKETKEDDATLDEIDLALKSLGTSGNVKTGRSGLIIDKCLDKFYSLLAIDKQHLNPLNEMKRLFGSVVLGRDDDEDGAAARRQGNEQGVNMNDFLSARYSRVSKGQGLSGLALRQNALLPGRAQWPKVTSGGLSMEMVEKADDFTIEYRFVHNAAYQRVQKEFEAAVLTMNPDAMYQMVYNNPYHISSLLQTAEILKQSGDHSIAADLYERALYNFGRSVQSTFASALAEGKARMDFRVPENREFWLTGYRYIGALVQKGTFRTAYEWAKLILSLDPEYDPYCIRLIIDQLALRGGQAEHLINLASTNVEVVDWGQTSPNIQISLALAHFRTKNIEEANDTLTLAVKDYPWIFTRLYQGLDLENTPKLIWGAQPRTDIEAYQTESYATRAKTIWNTPETCKFLNETIETIAKTDPPPPDRRQISLDEARHAVVSELPSLIGTVPRELTTQYKSVADPLPPPDTILSYITNANEDLDSDEDQNEIDRTVEQVRQNAAASGRGDATGVMGLIGRALNMFTGRNSETANGGAEESLGTQMGMEEVRVTTMEEYEDALNQGQWPVLDEAAAPAIVAELERLRTARPGDDESQVETDAQQQVRREQEAANVREAQSRRQATVEDDEDGEQAPSPDASTVPVSQQHSMGSMTRREMVEELRKDYDNDANKRWLAGRGMIALKEFVSKNGSDEKAWQNDPRVDKAPLTEYVARASLLRTSQDKNFILEYALKQGAGIQAYDMIRRLL